MSNVQTVDSRTGTAREVVDGFFLPQLTAAELA